ncbi:PREDICTED: protein shisa-4-like isoform X2 [Cyprinodon variegatus]|uniref:Protein shisa-5 n=1 Tax=Cyprinodon variegatus TaxID=28743 RepID=A0A3Q2GKW7_CYPVA|nr:PREDICTED: protein shisa-4-like isoform X2 [Cyprinodon variegatus]
MPHPTRAELEGPRSGSRLPPSVGGGRWRKLSVLAQGISKAVMASGLASLAVVILCAALSGRVFGGDDCKAYRDSFNIFHESQECSYGFCCGDCYNRKCCTNFWDKLSEVKQRACDKFNDDFMDHDSPIPMIVSIVGSIFLFLVLICCCICPCCCIYKLCRKPRPVVATTTHTTMVTSAPQPQYPQQPVSASGYHQPYQAAQYPPYQPMPVQPGYGTHPTPTLPYAGQPCAPGPPPPYQEAIGPAYPPQQPMPYSQAAYSPGQPAYPLQPPAHPQPNPPPAQSDFLAQPAYNPDYVVPPKTG